MPASPPASQKGELISSRRGARFLSFLPVGEKFRGEISLSLSLFLVDRVNICLLHRGFIARDPCGPAMVLDRNETVVKVPRRMGIGSFNRGNMSRYVLYVS